MLLVGCLENMCSDRALERLFQLRLDLLYFIDFDIGTGRVCQYVEV